MDENKRHHSPPWLVMGILNVTPDSFHDGGRHIQTETAVARAYGMAAAGAGIIDIGGESTRPGSDPVDEQEELRRVIPVVESIVANIELPLSIDTSKAEVARQALSAGAGMINDVTALRGDPGMAAAAAEFGCPVCLMHMRGEPGTMQQEPHYDDVIADIKGFFEERMTFATGQGIAEENIILDPGIGFGKKLEHNLEILRRLGEFLEFGRPVLVGVSRKSFIAKAMQSGGRAEPGSEDRLPGTITANVMAWQKGASIFRVHDVAENIQALGLAEAIMFSGPGTGKE